MSLVEGEQKMAADSCVWRNEHERGRKGGQQEAIAVMDVCGVSK